MLKHMRLRRFPRLSLLIVALGVLPSWVIAVCPGTSCDGPAELPRQYLTFSDTYPDITGYVSKTVCPTGCDYVSLQTALNQISADGGDTRGEVILLNSGQSYIGNFTLPKYTMAAGKWVIIRTNTADANLPPAGTRIKPSYAPVLAKILTNSAAPALQTVPEANHYWFMGVEIGMNPGLAMTYNVFSIGSTERDPALLPHHFVIDRCYFRGNPAADVRRGLQANGAHIAVVNSHFEEFHYAGFDSQAIIIWNTLGPLKFVNNYLEAASENINFGGAVASLLALHQPIPSDIEIRFNHFYKPLSWYSGSPTYAGKQWLVKNLLEFKNGQRALIEGNIFQHNWLEAQQGYAFTLTPRSENGVMPWNRDSDLTFRGNIIMHTASAFNIAAEDNSGPSMPCHRISIHDNLFLDVDAGTWGGNGRLFLVQNARPRTNSLVPWEIFIDHNTGIQTGEPLVMAGDLNAKMSDFTFTNNIVARGLYGISGGGIGEGTRGLNGYFVNPVVTKNVIANVPGNFNPNTYPAGNYFPPWATVQFTDQSNGNYRLAPGSPYKNAGTDGKDLGTDWDVVTGATCFARSGDPTQPCPAAVPLLPPPSIGPPAVPIAAGVNPITGPTISPNPWRSDRHPNMPISFTRMANVMEIKIFTVSGRLVKKIPVSGASVSWDLRNDSGDKVASGIYLILSSGSNGQSTRGKFAIIK